MSHPVPISQYHARVLRALTNAAGIEGQELAGRMGVHPSYTSRWLNGKRALSLPQWADACAALHVDLGWSHSDAELGKAIREAY